eukprot:COSAG02_NODE_1312_length_13319_cov_5.355371_1_plen_189_part_00
MHDGHSLSRREGVCYDVSTAASVAAATTAWLQRASHSSIGYPSQARRGQHSANGECVDGTSTLLSMFHAIIAASRACTENTVGASCRGGAVGTRGRAMSRRPRWTPYSMRSRHHVRSGMAATCLCCSSASTALELTRGGSNVAPVSTDPSTMRTVSRSRRAVDFRTWLAWSANTTLRERSLIGEVHDR